MKYRGIYLTKQYLHVDESHPDKTKQQKTKKYYNTLKQQKKNLENTKAGDSDLLLP